MVVKSTGIVRVILSRDVLLSGHLPGGLVKVQFSSIINMGQGSTWLERYHPESWH